MPTRPVRDWPDAQAAADDVMIALHARRSADAVAAWHAQRGGERLAVVLTGTDLYRDIAQDESAQRWLAAGTGSRDLCQPPGLQQRYMCRTDK